MCSACMRLEGLVLQKLRGYELKEYTPLTQILVCIKSSVIILLNFPIATSILSPIIVYVDISIF